MILFLFKNLISHINEIYICWFNIFYFPKKMIMLLFFLIWFLLAKIYMIHIVCPNFCIYYFWIQNWYKKVFFRNYIKIKNFSKLFFKQYIEIFCLNSLFFINCIRMAVRQLILNTRYQFWYRKFHIVLLKVSEWFLSLFYCFEKDQKLLTSVFALVSIFGAWLFEKETFISK